MAEVKTDTAQYSCKIAGETFQVLSFDSHEEISRLFRFSLNLWLDNPEVDIASKVRQPAEIKIAWGDKEKKYFGIVANMSQTEAGRIGEVDEEYGHYAVEVVPTLWLLGQKTNCKIFQEKGVDQIIKDVLDARGMAGKYTSKLTKSYPPREYCVQYRETDLAFISRLMEEEGICYFFTHDGEEKMVLGDSTSAYATCSPESTAEYKKGTGVLSTDQEYFSQLTYEESAYTGKVKYKDFNYLDPKKPLKVEDTGPKNTDLEIYDYHPERYKSDGRGRSLAKLAVEAQSAMRKTLEASGDWRSVNAGAKVTLEKAYRKDLNIEWVIVSATHSASQQDGGGIDYNVSIIAIPSDVTFRPMPNTPQPALSPQTATVVGPSGEEIYMDDLGRAKVQFHWDLDGSSDDKSSYWIRVAQHYAGIDEDTQKKHGFHWHPLVDDEVIVDFLEGDPDTPLIVGSVYNGGHTPPIKPDQLIRNMMLTRYQHCLLFDDKNSCITMSTGGGETLHMNDKKKDQGNVVLTTTGGETLAMEDVSDKRGNTISLSTNDQHQLVMSEKDKARGITLMTKDKYVLQFSDHRERIVAATKDGHKAEMNDKKKRIAMQTKDRHGFFMDDKDKVIVLQTSDGHTFILDDKNRYLSWYDNNQKHNITIDIAGSSISLSTSGTLNLSSDGDCNISGKNVNLSAQQKLVVQAKTLATSCQDFELTANNIDVAASGNIAVEGGAVEVKAQGSAKVEAPSVKISASGVANIDGSAMVIIKGGMVKIN